MDEFFVDLHPDIDGRRIIKHGAVGGRDELLGCFDVIVDFDVRCIPDVFAVSDMTEKFFDDMPVVCAFKFIRMAPEIEKPRIALDFAVYEFL